MEKEQIVKALKVCANYQRFDDCDKCPAREWCDAENNFLEREALSLIREQDKRIEELENICNSYVLQYGTATDKEVFLKKERADTVRKMVERLKEKAMDVDMDDATLWLSCVPVDDIHQIAKQLTEEKSMNVKYTNEIKGNMLPVGSRPKGEDAQYIRVTLWELNLDALKTGAFGNPVFAETLLQYWKAQEVAGYPYASENVKYFEEIIDKKRGKQ